MPPYFPQVMATNAAVASLSAAGRRLSSRCGGSASTIAWQELRGHHKLTIHGCAPSEKKPWSWKVTSKPFEAAGYRWRMSYYPNGASWTSDEHISLYLDLDTIGDAEDVEFSFSLLDRAGNPVPEHTRSKRGCLFHRDASWSCRRGFSRFVKWEDLVASGCLTDDNRFAVRCDIAIVNNVKCYITEKNAGEGPPAARVVVPPPDLPSDLGRLFWKKEGMDVEIRVGGEATFDAHGWLLEARCPELLATAKEKAPGDSGGRRRIEIQGMKPKVFKAMLRYMYTDVLPDEIEEHDTVAMAQGLLAAAHRYKMDRLKLVCEDMLCWCIDVDNVAGTLVAADMYGCRALKDACEEFLAVPGNLKAVMETEGFEKIKADCPSVLLEYALKQLA
ncbi:unnamed protein product [Urochloa decumbens]|uniref:Uncharacterized protein n=1 Tax=Urochloa decumbens TaxID=240449 RepID=A0ABC8WAF3_9POAL